MKVNIFEGARRIAKLLGGLWVIGCISFGAFSEPYSRVIYAVPTLNTTPILVNKECLEDDAREYITRTTPDGTTVNAWLCFVAHQAGTGEILVPYADDENGKVWMGKRFSTEVSRYTRTVARKFEFSAEGIEAAKASRKTALFEQWKYALLYLFGGVVAGWAFVAAMGWIVRGFMGMRHGQDIRPSS